MDAIEILNQKNWHGEAKIITKNPIGYLKHEPTGYSLAVYKPISRFKRLMLKWCFGLEYKPIK